MRFSEMKDKELIEMAEGLFDSVFVSECYGTHDLRNYEGVCFELEKRGYDVHTKSVLVIKKKRGRGRGRS